MICAEWFYLVLFLFAVAVGFALYYVIAFRAQAGETERLREELLSLNVDLDQACDALDEEAARLRLVRRQCATLRKLFARVDSEPDDKLPRHVRQLLEALRTAREGLEAAIRTPALWCVLDRETRDLVPAPGKDEAFSTMQEWNRDPEHGRTTAEIWPFSPVRHAEDLEKLSA